MRATSICRRAIGVGAHATIQRSIHPATSAASASAAIRTFTLATHRSAQFNRLANAYNRTSILPRTSSAVTYTRFAFFSSVASTQSNSAATATAASPAASSAPPSSSSDVPPVTPTATATATVTVVKPSNTRWQRLKRWMEENKHKWMNGLLAGGVAFGVYSINAFGFDLLDLYTDWSPLDAPALGFLTGIGCTLLSLSLIRATRRIYLLRVRRMYRTLLRITFNSAEVQRKLGEDVRKQTIARMQRYGRNHLWEQSGTSVAATASTPSIASNSSSSSSTTASTFTPLLPLSTVVAPHFRLASLQPARFHHRPWMEGWSRWVLSRRLQVVMHVVGSKASGILVAEVEQPLRGDKNHVNSAIVELVDSGERVIVVKHDATEKKRKEDAMEPKEEKEGIRRQEATLTTGMPKEM